MQEMKNMFSGNACTQDSQQGAKHTSIKHMRSIRDVPHNRGSAESSSCSCDTLPMVLTAMSLQTFLSLGLADRVSLLRHSRSRDPPASASQATTPGSTAAFDFFASLLSLTPKGSFSGVGSALFLSYCSSPSC